jgi:RHS repeat-associated protein
MNQKPKHTYPSPNSYTAAYGYKYMYDGFGGSAQASHGVSPRHTVTELGSSSWITDGSGNVNQYLAYMPFGESFIDQRTNHDIRFKFTTKEEDLETGYQYFGARYYASDLSVWLSVDPLADQYPSMSPYMYTAGNPVMLVDPDGKRIWVFTSKGQRLKYKDGELYQRRKLFGFKKYEGDDEAARSIQKDLFKLQNSKDKVVIDAVNTLQNSRRNININPAEDINVHNTNGNFLKGILSKRKRVELALRGIKMGSTIEYKPTNDKRSLFVLGHEIKHSLDLNNGTLKKGFIKATNGRLIRAFEVDAVNFENRVRATLFKPDDKNYKRTKYPPYNKGKEATIPAIELDNY